jgi:hypothetical protein
MANIDFPNTPQVDDEFQADGKTYKWDGVKWVFLAPRDGVDVSDATATVDKVLDSETFYAGDDEIKTGTMANRGTVNHTLGINGSFTIQEGFHSGSGQVTQNVATKGAQTFTPGTTNQTIAANQWLTGTQTILGDADLVSNNIRQNTTIFGVTGNLVPVPPGLTATGGTITTYSSGGKNYRVHTFTSSNNFVVSEGTTNIIKDGQVDYLIIAGGASGGTNSGTLEFIGAGGGGAGGYRTTLGTSGGNSSAQSKITVTEQTYGITIGAGGAAFITSSTSGHNNGVNSSALGITSTGGGAGATGNQNPQNGGSGGGQGDSAGGAGSGIAGQGTVGGNRFLSGGVWTSGGGGGSGQSGQTPNGGNGLANTLRTGSNETRAGGGGAGRYNGSSGTGGSGGGGNGGNSSTSLVATAGAVNTGSGGGGGQGEPIGGTNNFRLGGAGGSGIVIIRYEVE